MNTTSKIHLNILRGCIIISALTFLTACGGGGSDAAESAEAPKSMVEEAPDPMKDKGVGKFAEQTLELGAIDAAMADKGKAVFEAKCTACHRTTDQ